MKRFNRFELKYLLSLDQARAVRQDLLSQMAPDDNGAHGSYAVTSLYYDSPDLACMRSKREGIKFRRKLRVRRYGSDMEAPVWVEIKQRINRTTQKRRLALTVEDALRLCAGEPSPGIEDSKDLEVVDEVQWLVRTMSLQPTCSIGYTRETFVGGEYEPGLRVTFDRNLWAAMPESGLSESSPRHGLVPPIGVVMEVKANERVPLWLANLLARHQCPLGRYSKYCAGVARLAERDLLQVPGTETAVRIQER